ncbi:MAG: hypothetical protein AAF360_10185 [Pseudomonadota bacterium]
MSMPLQRGVQKQTRYARHEQADAYRAAGWWVDEMRDIHHGRYAALVCWDFADGPPVEPDLGEAS